jgi:hypothetical protein
MPTEFSKSPSIGHIALVDIAIALEMPWSNRNSHECEEKPTTIDLKQFKGVPVDYPCYQIGAQMMADMDAV